MKRKELCVVKQIRICQAKSNEKCDKKNSVKMKNFHTGPLCAEAFAKNRPPCALRLVETFQQMKPLFQSL